MAGAGPEMDGILNSAFRPLKIYELSWGKPPRMGKTKKTPTTTNPSTANTNSGEGKELIVQPTAAAKPLYGQQGSNPIIVFQGLTDDQFSKALSLFQPPPISKVSLFHDATFMGTLAEVVGYMESIQYVRKDAKMFDNTVVSNHFDNVMLAKIEEVEGPDVEEAAFFSVNEWFSDTRGPLPKAIKNWDPEGFEPMPAHEGLKVDWYDELTKMELEYNGYVQLIKNCIDMEEKMQEALNKRRHSGMMQWSDRGGQVMPPPIITGQNQRSGEDFQASKLLSAKPFVGGVAGMMGRSRPGGAGRSAMGPGGSSVSPYAAANF